MPAALLSACPDRVPNRSSARPNPRPTPRPTPRRTVRPHARRVHWSGRAGALGALIASVVLTALPAAAHDQLIETVPADASVVATAPAELTLRFSEDVMDISSQVILRGPAGEVVLDTEGVVAGALVSAPLPPGLGEGTYTVAWRVVSGDGHPIQGAFGFSIAPGEPPPAEAESPVASPSPLATPTAAVPDSSVDSPADSSAGTTTTPQPPSSSVDGSDPDTGPRGVGPVVVGGVAVLLGAGGVALLWRRRHRTE
ncbi:copper resistance CopC family protein [Pengzhenrongella frigida]|uniref:CopC domain-containing protein n=1 Tax=Pengzhenrongella frigida TaxID=1259133 RepID=A0A4Q5N0V8_9MICO|nr:copper resistance CopC family protein [Cellulomonas sp. HLT2-17]RYV51680.1 hypothetical protein EUA98_07200 [Cellulomonas sp. HLT2-17]